MEQTIHKCNSCFYKYYDKDREHPCKLCENYKNFVPWNMYSDEPDNSVPEWKPVHEAVKSWHEGVNGMTGEDYDVVSKPKHYMLFEECGIEVRDVIERLVDKISSQSSGMFISDYVQMMQYLMRFMDKNGVEDLKKARWYLDKLCEAYEQPHV